MPFGYSEEERPKWLVELYEKLAQSLNNNFENIYPAYKGIRIADFNPAQKKAFEMAQETGKHSPYFSKAEEGLRQSAKDFPTEYERYLNPFISSVIDNLAREGNRNFSENILPQVQSQFVGLGQHGSGKHQDLVARLARDSQEAILRKQLEAYSGAYEHSGRMFHADQERARDIGQLYGDLGSKAQASHLHDISAMANAGEQNQNHEQQNLDTQYQEFLNQQNYGGDRLVQQAAILGGIPYQGQVYGSAQIPPLPQPRVNNLGQIGSLAGNILGARMTQGVPRRRGGGVYAPYKQGLSAIRR